MFYADSHTFRTQFGFCTYPAAYGSRLLYTPVGSFAVTYGLLLHTVTVLTPFITCRSLLHAYTGCRHAVGWLPFRLPRSGLPHTGTVCLVHVPAAVYRGSRFFTLRTPLVILPLRTRLHIHITFGYARVCRTHCGSRGCAHAFVLPFTLWLLRSGSFTRRTFTVTCRYGFWFLRSYVPDTRTHTHSYHTAGWLRTHTLRLPHRLPYWFCRGWVLHVHALRLVRARLLVHALRLMQFAVALRGLLLPRYTTYALVIRLPRFRLRSRLVTRFNTRLRVYVSHIPHAAHAYLPLPIYFTLRYCVLPTYRTCHFWFVRILVRGWFTRWFPLVTTHCGYAVVTVPGCCTPVVHIHRLPQFCYAFCTRLRGLIRTTTLLYRYRSCGCLHTVPPQFTHVLRFCGSLPHTPFLFTLRFAVTPAFPYAG